MPVRGNDLPDRHPVAQFNLVRNGSCRIKEHTVFGNTLQGKQALVPGSPQGFFKTVQGCFDMVVIGYLQGRCLCQSQGKGQDTVDIPAF